MASRERIEIVISGGRPWGFSIKGGQESNKPLTISKLEKGGKAESAGLYIGDVLYSINNVFLSGSRNEAVQLVKMAGHQLLLEIERGSLSTRLSRYSVAGPGSYPVQASPNPQEKDHFNYDSYDRRVRSPDPSHSESNFIGTISDSRYSPSHLSASSSSLNEHVVPPHDVAALHEDVSMMRGSIPDLREQYRSTEVRNSESSQAFVKLRNRKARDRGTFKERPRSWHASKHSDCDSLYGKEEKSMRPPGSGYLAGPTAAPRYYHQPLSQPRRKSKSWMESGELKSVYRPDVNGSRDSLVSGDSHRSYRSSRLSVSSSRSSGTMSSSRGSLENLLDSSALIRSGNLECHPQSVNTSKYKSVSSHPQAGIVSQQKNIFERLCSTESVNLYRSRDDLEKAGFVRHTSPVENDKTYRNTDRNYPNSRFSPTSHSPERSVTRKKSRDVECGYQEAQSLAAPLELRSGQRMVKDEISPIAASAIKYSDAKIVKTSFESQRKSPRQIIPEPPQRDSSSALAVKNHYSRSFPNSQIESSSKRRSNSPHQQYQPTFIHGKSPPNVQAQLGSNLTEPSHRLTVTHPIENKVETGTRQERVFGVMSVGESGNLVAASTLSPTVGYDPDGEHAKSTSRFKRYEHIKDCSTAKEVTKPPSIPATDYVSRIANKVDEHRSVSGINLLVEHTKSRSDITDTKTKGKYGLVWKTPQNQQHNRAKSAANISSNMQDGTSREMTFEQNLILKAGETQQENIHRESFSPLIESPSSSILNDKLSSDVLSQTMQRDDNQPSDPEIKTSKKVYELMWHSESSNKSEDKTSTNKWKSGLKEVVLDERNDEMSHLQQSYVDNIKDMSSKVLRKTSFTRKDMGVRNSSHNKLSCQPAILEEELKSNRPVHGRSRSFGNIIEENDQDHSSTGNGLSKNDGKPRPKSGGVYDRPMPVVRSIAYPERSSTSSKQPSQSARSRAVITSFEIDDLSPSYSSIKHADVYKNRRVSIDVKPDSPSGGNGIKSDQKSAVIDYLTRTGKTFESNDLDKKHFDKERLQGRVINSSSSRLQQMIDNDSRASSKHGSVRKLKNFKETRQLFDKGFQSASPKYDSRKPLSRAKSTSSLLEEESSQSADRTNISMLKQSDRSASLENLLNNSSADVNTAIAPSTDDENRAEINEKQSNTRESHPKSSPFAPHVQSKMEIAIQPVPKKRDKHHKQRISNSSSASSATTLSSLSSYSSTSSTSIGIFPALGEESEQSKVSPAQSPPSTNSPLSSSVSTKSADEISASTTISHVEFRLKPNRIPIDTNTYRVTRRNKNKKSIEGRSVEIDKTDNSNAPDCYVTAENPVLGFDDMKQKTYADEIDESTSVATSKENLSKSLPAPPPPPIPLDSAAEKLLAELIQKRKSLEVPPPPSIPAKINDLNNDAISAHSPLETVALPATHLNFDSLRVIHSNVPQEPEIKPATTTRPSIEHGYENVRTPGQQYENVCGPAPPVSSSQLSVNDGINNNFADASGKDVESEKKTVQISSEPLLPDVTFLHDPAMLETEHPGLTQDIIKNDRALTQVFTSTNKKTLDYMAGVFSQPSHDILEEGMRYRRMKPGAAADEAGSSKFQKEKQDYAALLLNDISSHDNLPASSTYYKTSASKAKILNLMKEKLADGEVPLEDQESIDEVNHKKVELVLSIQKKLNDLQSVKSVLEVEKRENECLGRQVYNLTKSMCTPKEQDKYDTFVQEVDKIINLLLGLSARLARVENAIQMLSPDADKQEMELLCDKRKRLAEQHCDAKQLKESIDKRQKAVSEILARYFDREQFADYEHYIKMKSALIMEQRELDDKTKLGLEQIQCLRDSLPDEWQDNLDKLLEE